jgi:hypothetical protein
MAGSIVCYQLSERILLKIYPYFCGLPSPWNLSKKYKVTKVRKTTLLFYVSFNPTDRKERLRAKNTMSVIYE